METLVSIKQYTSAAFIVYFLRKEPFSIFLLLMNLFIYGAYGYTGELITRLAEKRGHFPFLGGRDKEKLRKLAHQLQLHYVDFPLDDKETLNRVMSEFDIVINCAGPFSKTARPLVEACLQNKVHYLDITGEIGVFEWVASKAAEAGESNIVLLPGVGFDVVPTDCLAAFLKKQLPDATHLALAFYGAQAMSRGTALTMLENVHRGGAIREKGKIRKVPAAYDTRYISFNDEIQKLGVTIPWGDVSTAWHSTRIPNIRVYSVVNEKVLKMMKTSRYFGWLLGADPVQRQLRSRINRLVTGPSEAQRSSGRSYIWGEVRNGAGEVVTARLETPEGYQLTAMTAILAAEKLNKARIPAGFHTPSTAFGADFVMEVKGVRRDSPQHSMAV